MSYLEDATGAENTSASSGGFLHNFGGVVAAVLGLTFFWPLLIPFYGTGENFVKESPWNYILEIVWLIMIIPAIRFFVRRARKHAGQ